MVLIHSMFFYAIDSFLIIRKKRAVANKKNEVGVRDADMTEHGYSNLPAGECKEVEKLDSAIRVFMLVCV